MTLFACRVRNMNLRKHIKNAQLLQGQMYILFFEVKAYKKRSTIARVQMCVMYSAKNN